MILPDAQGGLDAVAQTLRLQLLAKIGVAVLAGGAIGLERQIAGKAAGLRTNILICVGSALLMDLSISIGTIWGEPRIGDPARLAAQVITGIGFIGAGTIMQSRGNITGLTSAATIWVVAAIGLTAGAGFYVEALGGTAAVMLVLAGLGQLEHRILRVRRSMSATIRTKPGVTFEWLQQQLHTDGIGVSTHAQFDHADDRVFELRLSGPSRQFEIAKAELLEHDEVLTVFFD